eukprot:1178171-Karenia_brevis.AAC.1
MQTTSTMTLKRERETLRHLESNSQTIMALGDSPNKEKACKMPPIPSKRERRTKSSKSKTWSELKEVATE